MREMTELIESLKIWFKDQTIEERSIHSFWNYIEEYRKEEPEEFAEIFPNFERRYFVVTIAEVAFSIANWPEDNFNLVVVNIPVIYQQKTVAWYEALFRLSGEILDDTWKHNI